MSKYLVGDTELFETIENALYAARKRFPVGTQVIRISDRMVMSKTVPSTAAMRVDREFLYGS